jgi:hypothetical protein
MMMRLVIRQDHAVLPASGVSIHMKSYAGNVLSVLTKQLLVNDNAIKAP